MKSILVVEDEDNIRSFLKELLRLDYEVIEASSYEEAVEVLRSLDHLDLLITDIDLNGEKTGVDLIQSLGKLPYKVKVLAMSGLYIDQVVKGIPFLRKPYDAEEFTKTVKSILGDTNG